MVSIIEQISETLKIWIIHHKLGLAALILICNFYQPVVAHLRIKNKNALENMAKNIKKQEYRETREKHQFLKSGDFESER